MKLLALLVGLLLPQIAAAGWARITIVSPPVPPPASYTWRIGCVKSGQYELPSKTTVEPTVLFEGLPDTGRCYFDVASSEAIFDFGRVEQIPSKPTLPPVVSWEVATGYRFVRWTVTGRRAPTATFGNAVQIADFELMRGGVSLAWATGTSASNPGGSNPGGEGPPNLVDANAATKVLDFNFSSSSTSLTGSSVFVVTMPASREFDGYRFRTANDAPERDPVSWTIEGSEDGSTWKRLAQQTVAAVPQARGAWTATFSTSP